MRSNIDAYLLLKSPWGEVLSVGGGDVALEEDLVDLVGTEDVNMEADVILANIPLLLGGNPGDGTGFEPNVVDCKGFGIMAVHPQMNEEFVGFGASVVFDDDIILALAGSLVGDGASRDVEHPERFEMRARLARPRRVVVAHGEVGVWLGDCRCREES